MLRIINIRFHWIITNFVNILSIVQNLPACFGEGAFTGYLAKSSAKDLHLKNHSP